MAFLFMYETLFNSLCRPFLYDERKHTELLFNVLSRLQLRFQTLDYVA